MVRALSIFAVTYVLISRPSWPVIHLDRPTAGLIGAVLMVAFGVLTPEQAYRAIDWSTLVLLLGMFVLAGCLRLAGFFDWAAATTLRHVRTPTSLLAALVLVSGLLSALLVNDTVCVMLAPLVIALMARSTLPTRPYLFALAAGTNIGGVMTAVGNPQNMIIAHAAPLTYLAFARALAPVGLVSLGLTVAVLRWLFRSQLGSDAIRIRTPRPTDVDRPLLVRTLVCLTLVVVGFIAGLDLAWTALGGAVLAVVLAGRAPREILAEVDGPLLLFFAALFVIVGGLDAAQILAAVGQWVRPLIGAAGALGAFHLTWISTVASNVVSNVPWVLVAIRWIGADGAAPRPWLMLALTSTFAGNLTLFGSVANVIVFETARERIGVWEFVKVGVPLTLITTAVGVALLWCLA
jgi:Na+/H+ antiporter NhaD/arsenite permease-like protein